MSADTYYASKRAADKKPWRSGFCGLRSPLASHKRCHGGYDRQTKPVGWVECSCTFVDPETGEKCPCNKTPSTSEAAAGPEPVVVSEHQAPAGERTDGTPPSPSEPGLPSPAGQDVATEATALVGEAEAGVDNPASVATLTITAPAVVDDMSDEWYHADPVTREYGGSLSTSGAKVLYSQTPAHFAWQREHGRPNKRAFDIGHAVHTRVLGVGGEVVRIDADDYRTKAAREARDDAYAAGKVPLLRGEVDEVGAMAEAVLRNPLARVLFEASTIREQSIFWQDTATGMYLRCRPDSRVQLKNGRRILVDLKALVSADPADFGRTADSWGYVQQHPFYLRGAQAHDLVDADSTFLFVVVEKEPPYLVSVHELDDDAVRVGRDRNRRAIDLFAHCTEHDDWPGYPTGVNAIALPYWTTRKHDEEFNE